MFTRLFLTTAISIFFFSAFAQYPNTLKKTFFVKVTEGVCYFSDLKIGDKLEDIEKKLGKSKLISPADNGGVTSVFYPEHGLEFILQGEYVKSILLYPNEGSTMGDITKFKIFSRSLNTWKYGELSLNKSQPQDIMRAFGTENLNSKVGSGFISAGSNNVMGFKIVNSGGSQDIIFYFDKEYRLEHIANRLSKP